MRGGMASPIGSGIPADEVRVEARLSRNEIAGLLALGVALPAGLVLAVVLLVGIPTSNFLGWIVIVVVLPALTAVMVICLVSRLHVRALTMTDLGVVLETGLGRVRADWRSLRPGLSYAKGGVFQVRVRGKKGQLSMAYILSTGQARSFLGDPRSPRSLFPPEAWELAGLPSPTSALH